MRKLLWKWTGANKTKPHWLRMSWRKKKYWVEAALLVFHICQNFRTAVDEVSILYAPPTQQNKDEDSPDYLSIRDSFSVF